MTQGHGSGPLGPIGPIDTGRSKALEHVRYEDLLRAVGHYIDQHGMSDVVLTQIPDGILLKGTIIDQQPRGAVERIDAVLFTNDDIVALLDEGEQRRGIAIPLRPRGLHH